MKWYCDWCPQLKTCCLDSNLELGVTSLVVDLQHIKKIAYYKILLEFFFKKQWPEPERCIVRCFGFVLLGGLVLGSPWKVPLRLRLVSHFCSPKSSLVVKIMQHFLLLPSLDLVVRSWVYLLPLLHASYVGSTSGQWVQVGRKKCCKKITSPTRLNACRNIPLMLSCILNPIATCD